MPVTGWDSCPSTWLIESHTPQEWPLQDWGRFPSREPFQWGLFYTGMQTPAPAFSWFTIKYKGWWIGDLQLHIYFLYGHSSQTSLIVKKEVQTSAGFALTLPADHNQSPGFLLAQCENVRGSINSTQDDSPQQEGEGKAAANLVVTQGRGKGSGMNIYWVQEQCWALSRCFLELSGD